MLIQLAKNSNPNLEYPPNPRDITIQQTDRNNLHKPKDVSRKPYMKQSTAVTGNHLRLSCIETFIKMLTLFQSTNPVSSTVK